MDLRNYANATPTMSAKEITVITLLENEEILLKEISELIMRLEEKLTPVLVPDSGQPQRPEQNNPPRSLMANTICQHNDVLIALKIRCEMLFHRIEL